MQTTAHSHKLCDNLNFLCKLSENVFFLLFLLSNIFIFKWCIKAGYFIAKAGSSNRRRMILKFPFSFHAGFKRNYESDERNALNRENCTFPSWCTTLAWFQVLNCYFNMTTSHVLHHLHHTPSTHPARLSVDPSCAAVMGRLRNMCRLGGRARNKERNIAKNNSSGIFLHA